MKKGLISSDTVSGSDSCVMEEINDNNLDKDKCDMDVNYVDGVTDNSHLGLRISDNKAVDGDKKKTGLGIDLNVVSNEKNELDSGNKNPMPVDGEACGVHSGNDVLFDDGKMKNELDLVSNEIGCLKGSSSISFDEKLVECKEANVETIDFMSGPKNGFASMSKEERKEASTAEGEVGVNADPGVDRTVPKRKRGRPPKERKVESYAEDKAGVSAGDDANIETAVAASGPGIRFGKLPKTTGKAMSTFNKKVDVNVDADTETIVPRRKRGRPRKERRMESTVEEKVRARAGVNKGVDVDNAGDEEMGEEAVVDISASLLDHEAGPMECGENAAISARGNKHTGKHKAEKGRRGRKRKIVESSVHESDKGECNKRVKETPFDNERVGIGRVLRSRAVAMTGGKSKNENDVSSDKINGKMREESAHLSGWEKSKSKGLRGRPPKVLGKSGSKQKKYGLRKLGAKPSLKKVIESSDFEDMAGWREGAGSSIAKGKKSALKRSEKKHREEEEEVMRISTKKQLLKDRIKDMLKNAGWIIDYRPRNGKQNYYDAVYVSPKGRGYWSVTLAYKILKQEVESGEANSMAVSAYFPIAEDDWNSLLRITKKKLGLKKKSKKHKETKDQSSEVISRKKILRKKHTEEKDGLKLKQKKALKRSNGKEKKNKKRLTLLARGSRKGSDSEGEDFLPYEGLSSLLSWMIDMGTVPLGAKVKCMNNRRTKALLEGKVTKDGIQCDCCNTILALADFEFHSGSSLGQPLQNIYLDSKTSLLQCLKDSWSKYRESIPVGFHSVDVDADDPNDDTCNMCGDGGNLICCDSCPSAIHEKCLNLQKFPSGDWNCVYCCCKFCGMVGESTVDEDQNDDESDSALPVCRLCEEKYHLLCAQGKDASHTEPNSSSFCSQKCQEIFHQLNVLFGVKHPMEDGYSWTFIQRSDDNLNLSSLGGAKRVESNAKLAVAWSVMNECFKPILDQRSRINMIRNVVFSCGSNVRRLNYAGFFFAILERGDEVISAASLRIHGNLLAEMPFIGTRYIYRRQGMCRRLLNAIETALSYLKVEQLILPAIPELKQTWTSVFGFKPLEDSHKKEMKFMNIIAFPGVDMLQKCLGKRLFGVENPSSASEKESNGAAADVATVGNPTSHVPNVAFNDNSKKEDSIIPSEDASQDSLAITNDNSKKGDSIASSEDAHQPDNCKESDDGEKQENIPSGSCNVASNGNSKLNEKELAVSETISDPINCETKIARLSDGKEIVDCVLNGEVNAVNHSIDQHVNECGTSTQALVLV